MSSYVWDRKRYWYLNYNNNRSWVRIEWFNLLSKLFAIGSIVRNFPGLVLVVSSYGYAIRIGCMQLSVFCLKLLYFFFFFNSVFHVQQQTQICHSVTVVRACPCLPARFALDGTATNSYAGYDLWFALTCCTVVSVHISRHSSSSWSKLSSIYFIILPAMRTLSIYYSHKVKGWNNFRKKHATPLNNRL